MDFTMPRSYFSSKAILLKTSLGFLFLIVSCATLAASGPSVAQLSKSLGSTWSSLLKITNCNRKPPQDSLCIQEYHGKTVTIQLFGQAVNALILFETSSVPNVSGPVITQQSGFLIGPFDGYAYKIVHEEMAYGLHDDRRITHNGLKVYAHPINKDGINSQGVELNKGQDWLDGRNEPWIYHWSALAKVREALKKIKYDLKNKVW